MKQWDLTAGSAKLDLALKALKQTTTEINGSWDDSTFESFCETFIEPLDPKVKSLLEAVNRLSEVLNVARQQCRDEREE
jgi:hypothetical protein